MDISNFIAGKYTQQFQYSSFVPESVSKPWNINNSELNTLLSETNIKLGELNAYSQLIPDIDFFISMHVSKEATQSSRIEGTQTNIEDAFKKEEYVNPEKRNDWEEVQNYIKAMNSAIDELNYLPLSNRLLKQTHQILLQGVRGKLKQPGEFRKSQNWIGGSSLNDAVFVPPHQDLLPELMSDLELFINDKTNPIPDLIKIGIAHYQFETIHPFLDGNGRIGRLLITLYLVSEKLLFKPTLYISDFFEKNKILYYDNLTRVRTHNDLTQWLRFFLEGIRQTAINAIQTFKEIIILRQKYEASITTLGKKSKNAHELLQHLYEIPVVTSQDVSSFLNVNISASNRLIDDFVNLNILKEVTGFKRNRIFIFHEYIHLFEK